MGFEERNVAFQGSISWVSIGFRFGIGFFAAILACSELSFLIWKGLGHWGPGANLASAAQELQHGLGALPHPSLPEPAKGLQLKVDPQDRERCMKLSSGVVDQTFLECMRENASAASPP